MPQPDEDQYRDPDKFCRQDIIIPLAALFAAGILVFAWGMILHNLMAPL